MSEPETLFYNKLKSFLKEDVEINFRNRSLIWPYELDFYIPDYKLAIEVSPIFYHSHLFLENKEYHYNKFKLCKEKGVELITIFDWHVLDKIMKFIESKVDSNLTKIYARNCFANLAKGLTKEHKTFLNENHIQQLHLIDHFCNLMNVFDIQSATFYKIKTNFYLKNNQNEV